MGVWTNPSTATSGSTLTAATWNTYVRDNSNWLKGALNVLTASSASDTGNTTRIAMYRATTGLTAMEAAVTGDAVTRWAVLSDGVLNWGGGALAWDTNLYRAGASILATDDLLRVNHISGVVSIGTSGFALRGFNAVTDTQPYFGVSWDGAFASLSFGAGVNTAVDVNLYRSAVDRLKTDDHIEALLGLATRVKAGAPVDADWAVAPPIGTMVYDTTNSKWWVKHAAATWKGVVLA